MSAPRFSKARLLAYEVLRDVADQDAYANLALQARIRKQRLSAQDAAFATELTSGTLRLAGRYNAVIESAARRPIAKIDAAVLTVLQLGAHQLIELKTPAHAAIHEQVELAKHVAGRHTAGFVNGVLRTISKSTREEWLQRISASARTEQERLALIHSHPAWIVAALGDALGFEGRETELEAALIANNEPPRVQLAMLDGSLPDGARGLSPIGDELPSGNPGSAIAELARQGIVARVQDQGSQLAALALTRARPVRPGEAWLDLCAGPGGKTAVLAAEAKASGARVRANEIAEHRAELVRDAVRHFADTVTVVSHDGRSEEAFAATRYDRILIDAPCSGLGALRRRPEARWRKSPDDIATLATLQRELLEAATRHLAPDGILAYVTCSPHLTETRDVVAAHLREHPALSELNAQAQVNAIARAPIDFGVNRGGAAQLWPHRDETDAMFIALMRRRTE